ncbi:MAG TPA: FmdB family zinc ribbon protein [Vicinamibacteria bacterium]|nr:FmdB family zinc ribbon protein [Vicinamibacteria bacterium]
MPLYEYACDSCGTFEVIQRFSDPPLSRCPKCSGGVRKLLSAPAIQFKGTGWYITDYARKGAGEGKKPAEGASGPSGDGAAPAKDKGGSPGSKPDKS